MTRPRRLFSCSLVALVLTAPSARALSLQEVAAGGAVSLFQWREKEWGKTLVREDGPLVAAGVSGLMTGSSPLALTFAGELFGGSVRYDGQTQSSLDPSRSDRPVSTDVTYYGTCLKGATAWRFGGPEVSISPFAGVDYRLWVRDLGDTSARDTSGNSFPVSGGTETWQYVAARQGLHFSAASESGVIAVEAGALYPFYVRNDTDVALRPRGEWSLFGRFSWRWRTIDAALFYEGGRFGKSPEVITGGYRYWQPASTADIYGLNVAYRFR